MHCLSAFPNLACLFPLSTTAHEAASESGDIDVGNTMCTASRFFLEILMPFLLPHRLCKSSAAFR
jgi:hypothetical protein